MIAEGVYSSVSVQVTWVMRMALGTIVVGYKVIAIDWNVDCMVKTLGKRAGSNLVI